MQAKHELTNPPLVERRIQTGNVVVTTRFNRSTEAVQIRTKSVVWNASVDAEEKTFLFGEVTKRREREAVIIVHCPCQLAGIERSGDLVVDVLSERLSLKEVLTTLWIECTEKPKFIFDNRTTDVEPGVDFREGLGRGTDLRNRARLNLTYHTLCRKVAKHIAGKLIATALGDNVENTACSSAMLGAIRACFDFNFLDKLERQVRT